MDASKPASVLGGDLGVVGRESQPEPSQKRVKKNGSDTKKMTFIFSTFQIDTLFTK